MLTLYKNQLTILSFLNRSPNPTASCKPNLTNPSYNPELHKCIKQPCQPDTVELHFMPRHKSHCTGPECCSMQCSSHESSFKCG